MFEVEAPVILTTNVYIVHGRGPKLSKGDRIKLRMPSGDRVIATVEDDGEPFETSTTRRAVCGLKYKVTVTHTWSQ